MEEKTTLDDALKEHFNMVMRMAQTFMLAHAKRIYNEDIKPDELIEFLGMNKEASDMLAGSHKVVLDEIFRTSLHIFVSIAPDLRAYVKDRRKVGSLIKLNGGKRESS